MHGTYLGPAYAQTDIEQRLRAAGATFEVLDDDALIERAAERWPTGRRWLVPGAHGIRPAGARRRARSSAMPRSPTMQRMLNLKVKYRESFRPFAPSVLREDVADWFELDGDSPYMLLVADVAQGSIAAR